MHDGLILALISIGVVFTALLILYLFYGLMGEIFMRSAARRNDKAATAQTPAPCDDDTDEAARIAAAIAVALELENSRSLTFRPGISGWRDFEYSFRKAVSTERPSVHSAFGTMAGCPLRPIKMTCNVRAHLPDGFELRTSDVGTSSTSLGLSLNSPDRVAQQQVPVVAGQIVEQRGFTTKG